MTSSTQEHATSSKGLILGVDLGTTTVKACLVSPEGTAVSSLSRETKATLASELGSLGSEQDAHKICTALQFCLSQLPKEQLARVTRVAVSGQMHGVVLWKHGSGWKRNAFGRFDVDMVSVLYTWQDGRCSAAFLDALPRPRSHLRLSSGHGCATLFWMLKHRAHELERFDRAGAVQDLVVAMLCGLDRPVMSTQTAASWGYFDTVAGEWNTNLLREAGFLVDLLPDVVEPGAVAGRLKYPWYGIPVDTPVHAALGDMQCSVLSVGAGETDAVPGIEHRWHSLRQKILRLRKAYVKSGSGSDAVKKKWALFDNLMFLNDAIQSRSTVSSMKGGPRHLPPEVRLPNTFTPSSNSSTSAEALLQSMYMDSSEDTDRTCDNPLGQAAYVLEVGDQVAEPSSLSDNDVVEDDLQGPPGSEADSSACATATPTAPTGTRKTSSKKRNQVDIDELVVATLTENRKRLNELKYSNTGQDELFLLSMKPLLARLEDRKKEMTKITIHKLLVEAAFPTCEPGKDS